MRACEYLRQGADTWEERNKQYGDNYLVVGHVMAMMFPDGVDLRTDAEMNRFINLVMILVKVSRYCMKFKEMPTLDTMLDLSVYAAMQCELDQQIINNKQELDDFCESEEGKRLMGMTNFDIAPTDKQKDKIKVMSHQELSHVIKQAIAPLVKGMENEAATDVRTREDTGETALDHDQG